MTRRRKTIGVAIAVVMAFSAIMVSAAQAGIFEAEGEEYPTAVTGEQIEGVHEFVTSAGTTKCTKASFTGTLTKKEGVEEGMFTVTPKYEECKLAGQAVTVNTTGCTYTFTALTTTGSADGVNVTTHILCTGGFIIITQVSTGCEVKVPTAKVIGEAGAKNQSLTNIVAENQTTATPFMDVKATINVGSIHYTTNGKCTNDKEGKATTGTTGTYTGKATLKSSARGITVT